MAGSHSDLYIYYQVDTSRAAALAQAVRAMQAELGRGALKRRPGEKDGLQTWMEVYPGCSEADRAALEAAVTRANLAALTAGARHTEVFVELDGGDGSNASDVCDASDACVSGEASLSCA